MEEKADKKCPRCKTWRFPTEFLNDKGRALKSCTRCRVLAKRYREKNKCEHNRERNKCKDCGGAGICEHNRIRSRCKECGGAGICEHNRERTHCKDCGGSSICEHNRRRNHCKDCGGASICEHNRIRSYCKDCGGASICEHNRQRNKCKDCGGSSICEHNRIRSSCKQCGGSQICEHNRRRPQCKQCKDPVMVTINSWIRQSRRTDKKYNRYDANNFIDKCFCEGLVEDFPQCVYCSIELQYVEYQDDLATIERIDNSIGHTNTNCVLACKKCNIGRVGDRV